MQPSHFHQEIARTRHAEVIREATRRAELPREDIVQALQPRRPRVRLVRPRLVLRLVPA